ncbi:MAG: hypothetical protein DK303_000728 [Chloroflexi bacterium]|jgi:hypothetical protein|nr:MAG: hypothetical protein DK303_000728 [Chloroflexota bacterium]
MAGKWILKSGPKRGIIFGTLIFVGTTVLYIPLSGEWWIMPVRMALVSTFLPMLSDVRGLGVNPGFYFTVMSGITMLTTLLSGSNFR